MLNCLYYEHICIIFAFRNDKRYNPDKMRIDSIKVKGEPITVMIWNKNNGRSYYFLNADGKTVGKADIDWEASNEVFKKYNTSVALYVARVTEEGIPEHAETLSSEAIRRYVSRYERKRNPRVTLKFDEGGWCDETHCDLGYVLMMTSREIVDDGTFRTVKNPKLKYEYETSDN